MPCAGDRAILAVVHDYSSHGPRSSFDDALRERGFVALGVALPDEHGKVRHQAGEMRVAAKRRGAERAPRVLEDVVAARSTTSRARSAAGMASACGSRSMRAAAFAQQARGAR